MRMRVQTKIGLLVEARITSDGNQFFVDGRIEEGAWFVYATCPTIADAFKAMQEFITGESKDK